MDEHERERQEDGLTDEQAGGEVAGRPHEEVAKRPRDEVAGRPREEIAERPRDEVAGRPEERDESEARALPPEGMGRGPRLDAGAQASAAGSCSTPEGMERGPGLDAKQHRGPEQGHDHEQDHDEVFEEEDDDEEDEDALESVTIEISGLSIYTHHGVSTAEREVGQRLVIDMRLELGESDATATDQIEDTVDYAEVCQLVTLVAQQRSHRTLERLCSSIADRLLADYGLEGVWVKAAKPEPPIPLPVDEVSVEVWREPAE
jgi:dihydroneopterin aldolase